MPPLPNPPAKPLLVFDGGCGFCRSWVARWRRVVGDRVVFEPYQTAAARFPSLPRGRFRSAVQLLMPNGEVYEAAEAVFRTLALAPTSTNPSIGPFAPLAALAAILPHRARTGRYQVWLHLYYHVPGARPVLEWGYRWVADHRPLLTRLTHFLLGKPRGAAADAQLGKADEVEASELQAARRRRTGVLLGGGIAAALLLGGIRAWRARRCLRDE